MIVRTRHSSPHLARNLLGDPDERDLYVYLPPGYGESGRRYATAYLLHAFGQDAGDLVHPPTDRPRWSPPLEDVLDPVFGRLGVPPMIVVVPNGNCRWGCGQWVDSPTSGSFGSYVADDVVAHVDATYRTLPSPRSRGVLGFSSGGAGAWNLASTRPDVFGATAVLSADSYLDMTHRSMTYGFYDSIWPEAPDGPIEGNDLSMIVYAYAAAYSPNPARPPYFVDLPVDWPTGELLPDVWDRWLLHDPVVNWEHRVDNLRQLSGILLDAGVNDDHDLHWGHRILSHRLTGAGVPHVITENPGNHGGRSRERQQVALGWLGEVLAHG